MISQKKREMQVKQVLQYQVSNAANSNVDPTGGEYGSI